MLQCHCHTSVCTCHSTAIGAIPYALQHVISMGTDMYLCGVMWGPAGVWATIRAEQSLCSVSCAAAAAWQQCSSYMCFGLAGTGLGGAARELVQGAP